MQITERALVQRINRKLAPKAEDPRSHKRLCKSKGFYDGPLKHFNELGEFYVLDLGTNTVERTDVDIVELAKELNALAPWEALASN